MSVIVYGGVFQRVTLTASRWRQCSMNGFADRRRLASLFAPELPPHGSTSDLRGHAFVNRSSYVGSKAALRCQPRVHVTSRLRQTRADLA